MTEKSKFQKILESAPEETGQELVSPATPDVQKPLEVSKEDIARRELIELIQRHKTTSAAQEAEEALRTRPDDVVDILRVLQDDLIKRGRELWKATE